MTVLSTLGVLLWILLAAGVRAVFVASGCSAPPCTWPRDIEEEAQTEIARAVQSVGMEWTIGPPRRADVLLCTSPAFAGSGFFLWS